MVAAVALPLVHSWPLFESAQRFELGTDLDGERLLADLTVMPMIDGIGHWECDLRDNRLSWSAPVYELFGLPVGTDLVREAVLPLYAEGSRVLMERLRGYAIRHRRGFTLDAELRPADGGRRWMRLIGAPVLQGGRVIGLHGVKRDVTARYS